MNVRRYLLVALWPAGMAAITAATVVAARRASRPAPASGADDHAHQSRQSARDEPGKLNGSAAEPADDPATDHRGMVPARTDPMEASEWLPDLIRLGALSAAGGVAAYAVMSLIGPQVGNTWTTWGAAAAAAACLGVTWPRQKWLPPTALGSAIVVDHYATLALRHRFNRLGPPNSPLGTYPAGGPDRVVLFYGLIAHMLWRGFMGRGGGTD